MLDYTRHEYTCPYFLEAWWAAVEGYHPLGRIADIAHWTRVSISTPRAKYCRDYYKPLQRGEA